jgi:hypothetical protein
VSNEFILKVFRVAFDIPIKTRGIVGEILLILVDYL